MIRGSDGLEYADEAALLLREPIDNTFNGNVQSYRAIAELYRCDPSLLELVPAGRAYWTEERVRKYIEGFLSVCPEGYPGPSQAFGAAHDTGLEAAGFYSARARAGYGKLRFDTSGDFGVIAIGATY